MASETAEATASLPSRATGYFRESVEELKRVTTPTRQETMQATVVTLFIMFFVSVCLFLLDAIFSKFMAAIIG